jgi:hypothetical protein
MYQEQPNNTISNLYDVKIINKTFNELTADLKLQNIEGEIKIVTGDLNVAPQGVAEAKFLVILHKEIITKLNTPIDVAVTDNNKVIDVIRTSFLGQVKKEHN